MKWSKPVFQPNEAATLTIKTSPKSLCSVSAMDETTKSNDNINIRSLLERLMDYDNPQYYYYRYKEYMCRNHSDTYFRWELTYTSKDTFNILQVHFPPKYFCTIIKIRFYFRTLE